MTPTNMLYRTYAWSVALDNAGSAYAGLTLGNSSGGKLGTRMYLP